VSDTTSTPEEPDGRGTIATGASGQVSKQPASAAGKEPPAAAPEPDADETVVERPAAGPAVSMAKPGADPAAEEPTRVDTPVPSDQADTGKVATVRVPFEPVSDAPTVEHNGNGNGYGAPRPAPGPVPGPGPGSATPPPWNRIPGNEPPPARSGEGVSHPVSDLLTDAPTAFLEAPTPPGGAPATSSAGERSGAVPTSWRSARTRPPRQAALQLKRLDPWSVLKLALVLAVVLFLIFLVAVGVLYGVLDGMGVWDRLNGTYADLVSNTSPGASPLISVWSVFSLAAVVGAINSLLFAVAVTISAFVYNVSADLVGGVEVTLSERD
jgi:hypothetical protein